MAHVGISWSEPRCAFLHISCFKCLKHIVWSTHLARKVTRLGWVEKNLAKTWKNRSLFFFKCLKCPALTQKNIYSIRKSLKSSRGMSPHKIFEISPSFYNTFTVLPKGLPNCLQNPAPIIFLQMFSMTFTGIPFHLIIRRSIWKVLDDCFKKMPQVGAYALTRFIIEKQLGVMMYSNSHCLWVRWTYDFATFAPSNKIRLDENQKKTVDVFSPGNCLPSAVSQMQICPFVDQRRSSFEIATKQSRHQRCSTKVMIC